MTTSEACEVIAKLNSNKKVIDAVNVIDKLLKGWLTYEKRDQLEEGKRILLRIEHEISTKKEKERDIKNCVPYHRFEDETSPEIEQDDPSESEEQRRTKRRRGNRDSSSQSAREAPSSRRNAPQDRRGHAEGDGQAADGGTSKARG